MVADDYEEYMLKHWRPDVLCVQRQHPLCERATPLSDVLEHCHRRRRRRRNALCCLSACLSS
jgi:hypothetical protein